MKMSGRQPREINEQADSGRMESRPLGLLIFSFSCLVNSPSTAKAPTRVELMLDCTNKLHLHSRLESKQKLTDARLATSGLFHQSISFFFRSVFICADIFI